MAEAQGIKPVSSIDADVAKRGDLDEPEAVRRRLRKGKEDRQVRASKCATARVRQGCRAQGDEDDDEAGGGADEFGVVHR